VHTGGGKHFVIATAQHAQTGWLTASPLWDGMEKDSASMHRPVILRFTSDSFMHDLIQLLASDPKQLSQYVIPSSGDNPMKLFQPVHGHFHLLGANLVCALPGLPDRKLNLQSGETAL